MPTVKSIKTGARLRTKQHPKPNRCFPSPLLLMMFSPKSQSSFVPFRDSQHCISEAHWRLIRERFLLARCRVAMQPVPLCWCCTLHAARVVRCMWHVVCYMLHAACCMLHAACCKLPVASCLSHTACCSRTLRVARCLWQVACCLLHVAHCLLHAACCTLQTMLGGSASAAILSAAAQRCHGSIIALLRTQ